MLPPETTATTGGTNAVGIAAPEDGALTVNGNSAGDDASDAFADALRTLF